jgi:hypothetical protein
MMNSYLTDEIFGELFEKAPDRFEGDTHFEKVRDTVYAWANEFDNWIDPNSEYYAEELWEERREGAFQMRDKVVDLLEEAVYREAMFNESVNLLDLLKTVRDVEVE